MSAMLTDVDFLAKSLALKFLCILVAGFLVVAAVRAQPADTGGATARSMLELCKAPADTASGAASWALCAGRIQGWMTAHYMSALAYGGAGRRLYCEPSGWTVDQLAAAFVKWGGEHPELLNLSWNNGLLRALQKAYPCKQEN